MTRMASIEWDKFAAQAKLKWAKLTDDDLAAVEAKREELVARIKEAYEVTAEEAQQQVFEWLDAAFSSNEEEK